MSAKLKVEAVVGATENAGVENVTTERGGWKTQEWKTWHQNAGVINARVTAVLND